MSWPTLGVTCALIAPMCWSVALILYRRTPVSPMGMSVFKNALAIVLLTVTMLATGTGLPSDRPIGDWVRLAVSGILGLAVADTLIFAALHRIGAAKVALVDMVYAPLVMALSVAFLGERLGPWPLVGAAGVLAGVGLATVDPRQLASGRVRARGALDSGVGYGLLLAFAGICGTAFGVILTKPVLDHSDLVEVVWTRLVAGTAAQVAWAWARGELAPVAIAFRPGPAWRTLVPAAVLGTYLSLLFWLGGFKWADASIAAVLNQLGSVYTLLLARFALGETLAPRQVVGGAIAVVGAVIVAAA